MLSNKYSREHAIGCAIVVLVGDATLILIWLCPFKIHPESVWRILFKFPGITLNWHASRTHSPVARAYGPYGSYTVRFMVQTASRPRRAYQEHLSVLPLSLAPPRPPQTAGKKYSRGPHSTRATHRSL